jgi:hypothetical protein
MAFSKIAFEFRQSLTTSQRNTLRLLLDNPHDLREALNLPEEDSHRVLRLAKQGRTAELFSEKKTLGQRLSALFPWPDDLKAESKSVELGGGK